MQKWEYATVRRTRGNNARTPGLWSIEPIEPTLNALGEDGWELVGLSCESGQPGAGGAGYTTEEVWVFKRPKS